MKNNNNTRINDVLQEKEGNYLYPFFWLHGSGRDALETYVEKIRQTGCRAFCVESRPHPDFLGKGWWKDMDVILDKAECLGMQVWILDDAHFPTGYANGRVKSAPDDLKQWYLKHQELDFTGPVDSGWVAVSPERENACGLISPEEKLEAVVLVKRASEDDFSTESIVADLTDKVEGGWLKLNLPEGRFRLYLISRCKNTVGPFQDYMDMTNPESVKLLIEETYEKHYQHYADRFGSVITGFFSDEPGIYNSDDGSGYSFRYQIGSDMRIPWNQYIAEAFSQKLFSELDGESCKERNEKNRMRRLLPALWFPMGEETEKFRSAYMETLTELYQKNFTGQLSSWCHAHGVEYVGHVIEDNNAHARLGSGCGHYFRAVTGQDMSGIDVVLQQILPQKDYLQYGLSSRGTQDGSFNFYGLAKLGASKAHLDISTKGRAMCEIYGAYGWGEGITLMKWLTDHMLVRGINVFVPHAFSEKKFPDPDCPPHFYAWGFNPQYKFMKILFTYINRMCHLLNGGRSMVSVGIVYHAEMEWLGRSMYFHSIGKKLAQKQIDYDVVPIDALETAEVKDRVIHAGNLKLSCLIIPAADRYPEKLKCCLSQYRRAGIKLYQVTGILPMDSRTGNLWSFLPQIDGEILNDCIQISLECVAERLCQDMGISRFFPGKGWDWVRYYQYEMEDGTQAYMLFNESMQSMAEGIWKLPDVDKLYQFDVMENKLYQMNNIPDTREKKICLLPGETVLYLAGINDFFSESIPVWEETGKEMVWREYIGTIEISTADYREMNKFYKVDNLELRKEGNHFRLPDDKNHNFAGIIRYEMEIESDDKIIALDLGEVREGAEVWINGKNAGTRIGYPYYFDVSSLSVCGRNRIQIDVTTTLAFAQCDGFSRSMILYQGELCGPIKYMTLKW